MAWIGAGEAVLALPLDEDKPGVFSLDIEQRQTVRMTERVAITDLCEDCGVRCVTPPWQTVSGRVRQR